MVRESPPPSVMYFSFFFNDTATTEIYPLSLHDALPISCLSPVLHVVADKRILPWSETGDRKSTRLNSSHGSISYAVFCLQKQTTPTRIGSAHTWNSLTVASHMKPYRS